MKRLIISILCILMLSSIVLADTIIINEKERDDILQYREFIEKNGLSQVERYHNKLRCFNFNNSNIKGTTSIRTQNIVINNNIRCNDLFFYSVLDKTDDTLHRATINLNSIIYNKYGQVSRNEYIDTNQVQIGYLYVSIENYTKNRYKEFDLVLYTGNHNVTYHILRTNETFNSMNTLDTNFTYYKEVVSQYGFIRYSTVGFSTQVATIPNQVLQDEDEIGLNLDFYFNDAYNYNIDICKLDSQQNLDCFWDNGNNVNLQAGNDNFYPPGSQTFQNNDMKFTFTFDDDVTFDGFTFYEENGFFQAESLTNSHNQRYKIFIGARDINGQNPIFTSFLLDVEGSAVTGPTTKFNDIPDINLIGEASICYNLNNFFGNYEEVSISIPTQTVSGNFILTLDTTTTGSNNFNEEIEVTITRFANENVIMCVKGNDIAYNEQLTVSVFNDDTGAGGGSLSNFNVLILEEDDEPTQLQTFSNYNVQGLNTVNRVINDFFSNFNEVSITIDSSTYTVEEGSSDDTEAIQTADFNAILQYRNIQDDFIFDVTGVDVISNTPATIQICNNEECISRNFEISTSDVTGINLQSLNEATVLYYSADTGTYSGTTLFDLTDNENDGTASNSRIFGGDGILGEGLDFSQGGDSLIVSSSFNSNYPFNEISISLWAYRVGNSFNIFRQNQGIQLNRNINNNELRIAINNENPGWTFINTGYTLPANEWKHIVITYDTNDLKMYINNDLEFTTSSVSGNIELSNSNDLLYFGSQAGSSPFYDGFIDEVLIVDKALSSSEISYLYNNGAPTQDQQYEFSTTAPSIDEPIQFATIPNQLLNGIDTKTLFFDAYFENYGAINLDICKVENEVEDCLFDNGNSVNIQVGGEYPQNIDTFDNDDIFVTLEFGEQVNERRLQINSKNTNSKYNFYLTIRDENNLNPIFVDPFEVQTFFTTEISFDEFITTIGIPFNINDNFIQSIDGTNIDRIEITYDSETIGVDFNENNIQSILNKDFDIFINSVNNEYILELVSNIDDNRIDDLEIKYFVDNEEIIRTMTFTNEKIPTEPPVTPPSEFDSPSWFPTPPEEQQAFWGILVIIAGLVVTALASRQESFISGSTMAVVITVGLFLLLTYVGWFPLWILITFIIFSGLIIGFMMTKVITGGN